jgi:hypothetical protein
MKFPKKTQKYIKKVEKLKKNFFIKNTTNDLSNSITWKNFQVGWALGCSKMK